MTMRNGFLALLIGLATSSAAFAHVQATFHVAPNGDDANPGSDAKPFATIQRARQAVRAINRQMTGDIVVVLHGGTYRIAQTIVFDPADSGADGHNVIYRAAENETPILSGGKTIAGWQPDANGRWKAPAPTENFRQLYVSGVRATRARGEKPANLKLSGNNGYTTSAVEMADWKNPGDIELCYVVIWCHTRCKVQSIRREGDHAKITMLQPHFGNAKVKQGMDIVNPEYLDRIYVENALELLDEPGEWYLDRAAKTVYYKPRPGEDMTKIEVIAPAVEKLVELRGTLDQPVHNIRFEGITFEHGGWLLPSEIGFVDLQANFVLDWKRPYDPDDADPETIKSPSNVVCHAAKSIVFKRCTFCKLGSGGVDLEFGSQDNAIVGCTFHDISGSAVQVGDVLKDDHHPDDPRKLVKNNTVANNLIRDCGVEYQGSIGVFAGYTEGTVIAHNEICNLPYSGVSVGWGWGIEDAGGREPAAYAPQHYVTPYTTPTTAKDNRIEYNDIHGVMAKMNDGGAIYTLGNMPGTIIRGNWIHDCPPANRGWSQGIYFDQGSGFIESTGNLIYGIPSPVTHNNLAQNRNATCNEHDNFLGVKPEEHKAIMEKAGIEAEYRRLKTQ
jgi:hypothetical protein